MDVLRYFFELSFSHGAWLFFLFVVMPLCACVFAPFLGISVHPFVLPFPFCDVDSCGLDFFCYGDFDDY